MADDRQASRSKVIDPTANVIALVQAGLQRQDDLREKDVAHLQAEMALRAQHAAELREAEAKRIDAIRTVDVGNVSRAAEVAATQATTLAVQVAASAETLRTAAAAAANVAASALEAALKPLVTDIADLRRAQYEQQGRGSQAIESRGSNQWVTSVIVAIVGLFVAVVVGGSAIYARTKSTTPAPVVCTASEQGTVTCQPAK